jgi:preprotein translocase subunit SecE
VPERKKRVVKKSPTVRQQADKAQSAAPKKRRVRQAAGVASRPLKVAGRGVKKAASPFSFILWPFRLRPVRFVGRILYKILLIGYLRDSWAELRKVVWPGRRETASLTLAVFTFATIFALIVTTVDFGLDRLFKQLLL